jgi:phage N-6-adenine-methyltransferase
VEIIIPTVNKTHVSHNSGNYEWYTPSEYIEAAREVMGSIDIDPASTGYANKNVEAKTFYTEETNGLIREWRGNIWMNPPYSHTLVAQFTSKLLEKIELGEVKQAIVLVNNATETKWFQAMLKICVAICFPKGRIRFINPERTKFSTPLQGQAFFYFGPNMVEFIKNFAIFGTILCKN